MKGEVTWCQLGTWGAQEGSKDWGTACTFSLYFASRGTVTEQDLALVQFRLPGSAQSTRSPPAPPGPRWPRLIAPSFPVVPPWLISTHQPSPCSTCAAPQHFLQLPPLLAQLGELSPDFILLLLQPLLLLRKPLHLCLCPILAQLGFHCCRWKHNPPNQAQPEEKPGGKTSSGAWKQNKRGSGKSPTGPLGPVKLLYSSGKLNHRAKLTHPQSTGSLQAPAAAGTHCPLTRQWHLGPVCGHQLGTARRHRAHRQLRGRLGEGDVLLLRLDFDGGHPWQRLVGFWLLWVFLWGENEVG